MEPADRLGRIDTQLLYQPLCERFNALMDACERRGCIYVATSGVRTWDEQGVIYAKGRTTPPIGEGHIVTKAPPGFSPHNFGVATDFTRHKSNEYNGKLDPDYRDASYTVLAQEAERLGLESGLHWPGAFQDAPHVQLPLKRYGITWSKLREVYHQGGYPGVFAFLDGFDW